MGFNSDRVHKILHNPMSQLKGATWQPMTGPRGTSPLAENNATCRALDGPHVCHVPCPLSLYLPSQPANVIPATSACATCHPYSGDTCHPLTGLIPIVRQITCHVSSPGASTSSIRHVQSTCHMALYGLYSHPFFLPVWVF